MTSFLEDLKNEKAKNENKNEEVINEILNYFKAELDSEMFESALKNRLIKAIKNNKNVCDTWIEFWNYHSGCSETYFDITPCNRWTSNEGGFNSRYYKGVCLYDIHKEVTRSLLRMYMNKLSDLGLHATFTDDTGSIGYQKWKVTIDLDF